MGFHELSLPLFSLCNDYVHFFYLSLTRLWAIYHLSHYAHTIVFTLHTMPLYMILPCNCDPYLHLPMIYHYATPMCICMLGGDTCCYFHVYHVPHAIVDSCVGRVMMFHCYLNRTSCQYNDDTFPISCFHACVMTCELFMPTISCSLCMLSLFPCLYHAIVTLSCTYI